MSWLQDEDNFTTKGDTTFALVFIVVCMVLFVGMLLLR